MWRWKAKRVWGKARSERSTPQETSDGGQRDLAKQSNFEQNEQSPVRLRTQSSGGPLLQIRGSATGLLQYQGSRKVCSMDVVDFEDWQCNSLTGYRFGKTYRRICFSVQITCGIFAVSLFCLSWGQEGRRRHSNGIVRTDKQLFSGAKGVQRGLLLLCEWAGRWRHNRCVVQGWRKRAGPGSRRQTRTVTAWKSTRLNADKR